MIRSRSDPAMRSAFTLIEVLVSIGIIAVLVGLLLPMLSGTKVRASRVKALNDLRQIGVSIQLYTEDSGGAYPYFPPNTTHLIGPPDAPLGTIFVGNDDPWSMSYLWVTTMHRVAPWTDNYASWIGVGREHGQLPWLRAEDQNHWLPPGYRMSNSFVATPGTWSDNGAARVMPTRPDQVRYPSAKVMFFDAARPYLSERNQQEQPRGVLSADGSARDVLDSDATTPTVNRITQAEPQTYHDTPNGIHGRDF